MEFKNVVRNVMYSVQIISVIFIHCVRVRETIVKERDRERNIEKEISRKKNK